MSWTKLPEKLQDQIYKMWLNFQGRKSLYLGEIIPLQHYLNTFHSFTIKTHLCKNLGITDVVFCF